MRSVRRAVRGPLALVSALSIGALALGAAAAGKLAPDFTLTDQRGHAFTLSRSKGHPVVLFFGYTNCPDVCPTILANLKRARSAVGREAADTVVALVTVDAARDTRAELGRYVANFDASFLGLTGTDAALRRVYHAYHVRIIRQAEGPGSYLVSHTAFVYYIARDGRVDGYGTWNDPPDVLEEDLRRTAAR